MEASAVRARLEAEATADIVGWAHSFLGLTYDEVGVVARAARRSAIRWANPKQPVAPSAKHRARLNRLRDLRFLLLQVFLSPEAALEWLHREIPLLRGQRPIDVLRRGDLDEVIEVLATVQSGAFVASREILPPSRAWRISSLVC